MTIYRDCGLGANPLSAQLILIIAILSTTVADDNVGVGQWDSAVRA